MPAFIETQFPIARLSAESYKERKANNGQALTAIEAGRVNVVLA
jgi:putative DNA methylase